MNFLLDITSSDLFSTLPLIGLYAETHFRFWIPFSRYFRREPELIFDTPWRLQPGQTPTIFLVIKEAHTYPVQLTSVAITVYQDGHEIHKQSWQLQQMVNEKQSQLEFALTNCQLPSGEVEIKPILNYIVNGQLRQMEVDNYPQIAKKPLHITIADERLPILPGWLAGDTHLHSSLTNDQIEFGAALEQLQHGAQLLGLDFLTATDHSYDLDDQPDNYLVNDPDLVKWHHSRHQIEKMNVSHGPTIIPGEEISVSNTRGATVHFLHYNDPVYFPGSGDSGDDWPKVRSQLSIDQVLAQRSDNTVSIGAHTAYQFPWLPRILLNRGSWETTDHENPLLDGVQILCGTPASTAFQDSRQLWINALLNDQKLAAYGGSDAHGNFNRNWHVKIPLWSLGSHEDQIFAQSRTLLRSDSTQTNDLIEAMQARRTALTTGPVGDLIVRSNGVQYGIGDILKINRNLEINITINGLSTVEFGSEMDVALYWGDLSYRQESILYHAVDLNYKFERSIPFSPAADGYLRLEITSEGSRWPGVYLSSPIWIELQ